MQVERLVNVKYSHLGNTQKVIERMKGADSVVGHRLNSISALN